MKRKVFPVHEAGEAEQAAKRNKPQEGPSLAWSFPPWPKWKTGPRIKADTRKTQPETGPGPRIKPDTPKKVPEPNPKPEPEPEDDPEKDIESAADLESLLGAIAVPRTLFPGLVVDRRLPAAFLALADAFADRVALGGVAASEVELRAAQLDRFVSFAEEGGDSFADPKELDSVVDRIQHEVATLLNRKSSIASRPVGRWGRRRRQAAVTCVVHDKFHIPTLCGSKGLDAGDDLAKFSVVGIFTGLVTAADLYGAEAAAVIDDYAWNLSSRDDPPETRTVMVTPVVGSPGEMAAAGTHKAPFGNRLMFANDYRANTRDLDSEENDRTWINVVALTVHVAGFPLVIYVTLATIPRKITLLTDYGDIYWRAHHRHKARAARDYIVVD